MGLLGNIIIIDSTGFSVNYHSFYYDNDFGKRVRKKYVKATICVDDKSQIIVAYSVGEIHDLKEILKSMDSEIINKFKTIIGDKRYDSERGKPRYCKKTWSFCYNTLRNEDVPVHRTKGENRKKMKRHLQEEYKRRSIVETVHSVL